MNWHPMRPVAEHPVYYTHIPKYTSWPAGQKACRDPQGWCSPGALLHVYRAWQTSQRLQQLAAFIPLSAGT